MFLRPRSDFDVAPRIAAFRSFLMNYFMVGSPIFADDWVLVDAGLRSSARRIFREARRRFGGCPPQAILLTHEHFDHVGALPQLVGMLPVYAHALDLPFLNERRRYPSPDSSVGGGGHVPGLPGWRTIETPGHMPGHVSFLRESDRLVIAGDAVVTTRQESLTSVWLQRPEVRPPPAYFTPGWQRAHESIRRLRALRPKVLVSGHGLPISGERLRAGLDRAGARSGERRRQIGTLA